MSEQDTPMDALDRRLTAYLEGRAEMAAAFGPGPDHLVTSIAGSAGRGTAAVRPGLTQWRGVPTLAWLLLLVAVLAAMAVALAAGGDRDNGLVVVPPVSVSPAIPDPRPASAASQLRGSWVLDFDASGIDDTYPSSPQGRPGGPETFGSSAWFGPDGVARVMSGAGGGCHTQGTWQATGARIEIKLPTGQDECSMDGEIRLRLASASAFALDGVTLTLRDKDGGSLLVYERRVDASGEPIPDPEPATASSPLRGTWLLDFAGSGIDNTYGGPGSSPDAFPFAFWSVVWFGPDGDMTVSSGAGGGCDIAGTWRAIGNGVSIAVPTGQDGCELTGPGPAARQIRERLAAAATWELDGATLSFLGADGRPSLVYERPVNANGDPFPTLWELGAMELDFAASGIDPSVTSGGEPSPVTSSVQFDAAGGLLVVTAQDGEPCDRTAGTYDDSLFWVRVTVPTLSGSCGEGPAHPDLEIRRQLARVALYEFADDGAVRLTDDNGNVLLVYRGPSTAPPPSGDPASIEGAWWLDFAASGIDDTYVGGSGLPNGLRFLSGIAFEPGGRFRVASGAGGGCETTGTWGVVGSRLAVDVSTEGDGCEAGGPGPAALEIRRRVARVEQVVLGGTRLTLLDASGDRLLVFDRSTNGRLWRSVQEGYERRWQLDFEASGIVGSYPATSGPKRSTTQYYSFIELAGGVVSGGTSAGGGGCDHFEGTYSDADGRLTIDLPDAAGHCGSGPVYPDLEVRQHLERTAAWRVDGDELRLLDENGALLLHYRSRTAATP